MHRVARQWTRYSDYQPCFPTKWMSEDGKTVWMVSAGTFDDYNFTVQKLELEIAGSGAKVGGFSLRGEPSCI
jgi:hypothetical protein